MILERLRRAVQRQDWFAVALEVLIVVVGVAIAFQVTAWGNERAAKAEEQKLLRGLQSEFFKVAAGVDAQIAKHRRIEAAVATTLATLKQAQSAGAAHGSVADGTLAWAFVPTTTQFSQGILSGMLRTGQLGLIRDQDLRTALSEWDGVLADVTEDEVNARDLVVNHLGPILWSRMDISPFHRYAHVEGTLPQGEADAVSNVGADVETIGVFASRLYWQQHVIREFEGPRAEARYILSLIDRSLE